ncbi:MAG: methyltransferase domain-containing protein [Nitrosomonadales bacterium]|nr:methyltransferase domain-containing protein [Nitrosomonadales bacterium]
MMWGIPLPTSGMHQTDIGYLRDLASRERPAVEWIWQEMDRAWDELALDNKAGLQGQAIGDFYSHPVWIVNGVFSASDPVSIQHRESIAAFASRIGVKRIADYGGGFGELALRIHAAAPQAHIDIVEPYASQLGMLRMEGCSGIRFVEEFDGPYDCVVAQDVLEHVEHPLKLAEQMVLATRPGGYLILANCFYPVVKCHLPSTFYLRHTFTWVVSALGLKYDGCIEGAGHALVFRRRGNINRFMLALFVPIAKLAGPLLNMAIPAIASLRRRLGT